MASKNEISQLIEKLDQEITTTIESVVKSFAGQIVLGYNTAAFLSRKMLIAATIQPMNDIHKNYVQLLDGKESTIETLKEALTLPLHDQEQLGTELKLRYINWKKIQIPNFPYVRAEKIVDIFDFPSTDEQQRYDDIIKQAKALTITNKFNWSKYFRAESGRLEFSPEDEKDLLSQHTLFANEDQLEDIISVHLLCMSLNNLKMEDYSFQELPEIDHRIMRMIDVGIAGNSISVDIDKINGLGVEQQIEDQQHFELLGTNDDGLPMFFFNGRAFEYTAPRFGSPFPDDIDEEQSRARLDVKRLVDQDPEKFIKTSMSLVKIGSGIVREIALPVVTA